MIYDNEEDEQIREGLVLKRIVRAIKRQAGETADEMRSGYISEANGDLVVRIVEKIIDNTKKDSELFRKDKTAWMKQHEDLKKTVGKDTI